MNKFLLTLIAIASLGLGAAHAQTSGSSTERAMLSNAQLYQTFGEKPGLVTLVDDFMQRLLADPRTGPHFKPANQAQLKQRLVEQFCVVSGGPCTYQGADMKSAHSNLDITKSDFNALVEVLQRAMDAQGIPFAAQNQLLAKLAPLHRDVITVK